LRGCRSRSCRVATAAVAGVPLRSARLSLNSKCFCCLPVSQLEAFTSLSSLLSVGSPVPQLEVFMSLPSAHLFRNSKCFCRSPVSQLEAFTSLSSLSSVGSPVPQLEVFVSLACLSTGSIHISVVSVVRRLACPSTPSV
jgi:hypothetical protein